MKNFTPLKVIHLILMIGLMLCSGITTVMFLGGFDLVVAGKDKSEAILNGCSTMAVTVMLLTGVLYLLHGYKKRSAVYYMAFILLLVLVNLMVIILDVIYATMTIPIIIKCVLYAIKIILLLLLVFKKDLGREKTWFIFNMVVIVDIAALIVALIITATGSFDFGNIMGVIAALVADATLGLAIHGKYADKESRGTQ